MHRPCVCISIGYPPFRPRSAVSNPCHVLTTPQNPALLAFAQSKLDGLVGKPSGYIESLPPAVRRRIDGLKGVQAKHSEVEGEFQLAILELEKKVSCLRC